MQKRLRCLDVLLVVLCLLANAKASAGIGISYDQAMRHLSDKFSMKQVSPVGGAARFMGSTSENLATIELIGSKSDIQQATFMLGLPNDAPSVVRRNTLLLSRFLENIVPEWPSSDVWVAESTKKLVKRGEKISVIKGRKIIEIDFLQPLGIVVLSIREK